MLLVIVDFVFPLFDFMHQLGCSTSSVEFEIESYLNLVLLNFRAAGLYCRIWQGS